MCLVYTVKINMLKEQNLTQAALVHFLNSEGRLRFISMYDLILQIMGTEDSPARAALSIGSHLSSYEAPGIVASIILLVPTQNRSRLAPEPEPQPSAPLRLSESLQVDNRAALHNELLLSSELQAENIALDAAFVRCCVLRMPPVSQLHQPQDVGAETPGVSL